MQDGRHVWGDEGGEVETLGAGALPEQAEHGVDGLDGIEGEDLELHLAGLDLREVEDVVDDGEQALSGAGDDVGEAALTGRQLAGGQQFGHDQHAVHRRADLVAHRRQEVGLGSVRILGGDLGDPQVAGAGLDLAFKVLGMPGDAGVTLVNLAEHVAEAVDELAHLVVAGRFHGDRVIVAAADAAHGGGEAADRAGDPALHLEGHAKADDESPERGEQRGEQRLEQTLGQAREVGHQQEASHRLPFGQDRGADADRAAELQPQKVGKDEILRGLLLAGRVEGEISLEHGGEPPVGHHEATGIKDGAVDHVGDVEDAVQRRVERGDVAAGERRTGRLGEDLRGCRDGLALGARVAHGLLPHGSAGADQKRSEHRGEHEPGELRADRAEAWTGAGGGAELQQHSDRFAANPDDLLNRAFANR